MSTQNEEKTVIINDLKDLGCCPRCIIRYSEKSEDINFKIPDVYCENSDKDENVSDPDEASKKFKKNPCRVCLDILQESSFNDFVAGVVSSNVNEYDENDFQVMVSFPKSVYVRCHSIFIYLNEKYPEYYKEFKLIPLNKYFRMSIADKIAAAINKTLNKKSLLEVNLIIGYQYDEEDVENMIKIIKPNRNSKHHKKNQYGKDLISRNNIQNILETVDDAIFKSNFPVPPDIPTKKADLSEVVCMNAALYLGGRYLKFSRDMGQTPWIINGKKVTEHCLQDIIFDSVRKILGFSDNKFTFCASGREDANVRMLGNGRPFYIQIDNPKRRLFTSEEFRKVEEDIAQSKLAKVNKLQIVHKSDLKLIKEGEEHKRKTYEALCKTTAGNVGQIIDLINKVESLEIAQKTPLRVLHRRTQATRKKNIYKLNAITVTEHEDLFILQCTTQAGTYVKEFVHGDFERTLPNLGTIIGHDVDIVALDVIDIDLNWPDKEGIDIDGQSYQSATKCISNKDSEQIKTHIIEV